MFFNYIISEKGPIALLFIDFIANLSALTKTGIYNLKPKSVLGGLNFKKLNTCPDTHCIKTGVQI